MAEEKAKAKGDALDSAIDAFAGAVACVATGRVPDEAAATAPRALEKAVPAAAAKAAEAAGASVAAGRER